MSSATLTSKGQITIPKDVRDRLGLETGDRVEFLVQEDGRVLFQPATLHVRELKGVLYKKGRRPVSVEEMHATVAKRAARKR